MYSTCTNNGDCASWFAVGIHNDIHIHCLLVIVIHTPGYSIIHVHKTKGMILLGKTLTIIM